MQKNIEKTAKNINNYKEQIIYYESARKGFSAILKELKNKYENFTLLLPGFIGYSPNEGSGIYDPIIENNIKHQFYPLDDKINIIVEEYEKKVNQISEQVVILLVHYYGYIDKNIKQLIKIAKNKNAIIIEDCAHALYTDFVDKSCGRYSDFSIYSLHKMLPYNNGGMIKVNNKNFKLKETNIHYNIIEYDIYKIAKKRKYNSIIIENELNNVNGIEILRPNKEYKKQTPQTFPIIITNKDKNYIYHRLNEEGYGVVSLYHTMIDNLKDNKTANSVSKKILNLPVHQDAKKEELLKMCKIIRDIIES